MAEDKKEDPWVVINELIPTSSVCYNLQDEVTRLRSGHTYYYIEGPEKGFKTREEAVNRARKFRRGECMFEGWDELYKRPAGSDDDGDKDDEEDEDEKEDIIDEPELPWCSTDLDHIDHDEDQVIHVVLLSDYSNEEIERRNNILRRA